MKKSTNKDLILEYIKSKNQGSNDSNFSCETNEIAQKLNIKRANVSKILNELYIEGKVLKIKGKPVLYKINSNIPKKKKLLYGEYRQHNWWK